MKKNQKRLFVTLSTLLVVFSVIAFVVPFAKTASFWCGFIFGVIAIALQLYVFKVALINGENAKSKFYGFPIAKIGLIYVIVQLLISLIEMIAASALPVWISITVNFIAFAVFIIGCITAEVVKEVVVRQDVQISQNTSSMRELQVISASLIGLSSDAEVIPMIQDLVNEFKYSDPVSSDLTSTYESSLKSILGEIRNSLLEGNNDLTKELCAKVKNELIERNRVCKLGKNI